MRREDSDSGATTYDIPLTFVGSRSWTHEQRVQAWKQFDRFARWREPTYRRNSEQQLRREFKRWQTVVRTILNRERRSEEPVAFEVKAPNISPEEGAPIPPELPPALKAFIERARRIRAENYDEWVRRYRALHQRTSELVVGSMNGEMGLSLSVFNPLIQDEIETRVAQLADTVTINNYQSVVSEVFEGIRDGDSTQQIAARIMQIHDEGLFRVLDDGTRIQILSARQRAELIARTETTAMANGASLRSMEASPLDRWKEWLSVGDERVRPAHIAEEGSDPRPLNIPFPVTGLQYPQEPNCRCSLIYVEPPEDADPSDFEGNVV